MNQFGTLPKFPTMESWLHFLEHSDYFLIIQCTDSNNKLDFSGSLLENEEGLVL